MHNLVLAMAAVCIGSGAILALSHAPHAANWPWLVVVGAFLCGLGLLGHYAEKELIERNAVDEAERRLSEKFTKRFLGKAVDHDRN